MRPIEQIEAFLGARNDAKSPPEKPKTSATSAPTDDSELTPEQLAEARRIAGELVKIHKRGVIKSSDDPEARFYATMIHQFGGTVIDGDKTAPDGKPVKLTAEQKVKVPFGLRGKALADFLRHDLEDAFGE